jgi:hypothetical protein
VQLDRVAEPRQFVGEVMHAKLPAEKRAHTARPVARKRMRSGMADASDMRAY